jgi:hypothetical protein
VYIAYQPQVSPLDVQLAPLHLPQVVGELVRQVRDAKAVLKAVVAGLHEAKLTESVSTHMAVLPQ